MKTRATLMIIATLVVPALSIAHPGRTDSSGGHYDRKNGGYHYHGSRNSSNSSSSNRSSNNQVSPLYNTRASGSDSGKDATSNAEAIGEESKKGEFAAKRLRLAKAQLETGIKNLQEIASSYPGTEAGDEAADLCKKITTEMLAIAAVLDGKEKPKTVTQRDAK